MNAPAPLALTDDEVVALSVVAGEGWHGPTPTVDVADSADVERAARRGRRSLSVRGLIDHEGTVTDDRVQAASALVGRTRTAILYFADPDQPETPRSTTLTLFDLDGQTCAVLTTDPTGTHWVQHSPDKVSREIVRERIAAAYDDGVENDLALVVAADFDPHQIAVVTQGRSRLGTRTDAGFDLSDSTDELPVLKEDS